MFSEEQKPYVVQSNHLIQAHYRLTFQEKRLVLWLVSKIQPRDENLKKYTLNIVDFAQMMGLHAKTQYREMKKITKSLIGRVVEIEIPEDGSTKQFSWLGSAHWKPEQGVCFLSFHPDLKPYLLQLKGFFTKIEFDHLKSLKSVSSIRIFELLMQYESIGNRILNVKELKNMLGINPSEYELYANFKQRILDASIKEISDKTGYEITYHEIKESRRVGAIEFTIKKRTHFEKHQLEKSNIIFQELRSQKDLIEKMKEYGFSRITAKKFIQQNSEEIVRDALKSVNSQVERNNVKNPKAMLRTAIQERWKPDVYLSPKKAA
jgi:plasmid replication initiation protein